MGPMPSPPERLPPRAGWRRARWECARGVWPLQADDWRAREKPTYGRPHPQVPRRGGGGVPPRRARRPHPGTVGEGAVARGAAALSQQRFRPPGAKATRSFSVPTLERWYYAYKRAGLPGLVPTAAQRQGPRPGRSPPSSASCCWTSAGSTPPPRCRSSCARSWPTDGSRQGAVSATTVRRLLREAGLDRAALRDGAGSQDAPALAGRAPHGPVARRRVPRPRPHRRGQDTAPAHPRPAGRRQPLRRGPGGSPHRARGRHARPAGARPAPPRHARRALPRQWRHLPRRHPGHRLRAPRHHALARPPVRPAGPRQDGALLAHAARGLPRLPRRPSPRCTTSMSASGPSSTSTTTARRTRLLLGALAPDRLPRPYAPRPTASTRRQLREALTVRIRRRVRRDTTVAVGGEDYELDAGHLAGRIVTLCRCLVDPRRDSLGRARGQAHRPAPSRPGEATPAASARAPAPTGRDALHSHPAFDPPRALLDKAVGPPSRARRRQDGGDS